MCTLCEPRIEYVTMPLRTFDWGGLLFLSLKMMSLYRMYVLWPNPASWWHFLSHKGTQRELLYCF